MLAASQNQSISQRHTANTETVAPMDLLIKIKEADAVPALEAMGVTIRSNVRNRILTAKVQANLLQQIAELESVESIELAPSMELKMDAVRAEAGADMAHQGGGTLDRGYAGKGVMIGIVDSGFEYTHLNFKAKDGVTPRLIRAWNQVLEGEGPENFGYGVEYTDYKTAERQVNDKVTSTFHGTHVAGIAGGGDYTTPYYGVAPESDLVFVTFKATADDVIDGVKYIFDQATEAGKPCVINLSLGAQEGPHDGTSLTDQALDMLTGPGRIIVGAVGNHGTTKAHVAKNITKDAPLMVLPVKELKTFACNFWGEPDKDFYVQPIIVNTLKGTISYYGEKLYCSDSNVSLQTFNNKDHKVTGSVNLAASFFAENGKGNCSITGEQTAQSTGYAIGLLFGTDAEECMLNGWNNRNLNFDANEKCLAAGFSEGDNHSLNVEVGGTAKKIITVGSYNSRTDYTAVNGRDYVWGGGKYTMSEFSDFSSSGPTIDGRMKPEVCAPGAGVISSAQRQAINMLSCAYVTKDSKGQSYYYEINGGTSMAAPYVTGSIALWLEANPDLSPEDIRSILRRTSRHDAYTGNQPDNSWGYGKIDTFAGLVLAANYHYEPEPDPDGINTLTTDQNNLRVAYDRSKRELISILPDTSIEVYSSAGQLVSRNADLHHLPAGTYIVRLKRGMDTATQKIIL